MERDDAFRGPMGGKDVDWGRKLSSGDELAELEGKLEKRRKHARDYARRKRRELDFVRGKVLLAYNELVRLGVFSQLSKEAREIFDVYVHREIKAGTPYPPNLYAMFGKVVAPGVSCTLREAMQRLYKGKSEINYLVKKWGAKHGVHIAFEPSDGDVLDSNYVITMVDPLKRRPVVDDVSEFMSRAERRGFDDYESGRC